MEKLTFTEIEAARYLEMSASYLRHARCHGRVGNRTPGPSFVKIGRTIRYLREDLDAWLDHHRIERSLERRVP